MSTCFPHLLVLSLVCIGARALRTHGHVGTAKLGVLPLRTTLHMSTSSRAVDQDGVKKWFLLNNQYSPEVIISNAGSQAAIVSEIWRGILISARLFDADLSVENNMMVFAFPACRNFGSMPDDIVVETYDRIAADILQAVDEAPEGLLRGNVSHSVKFYCTHDLQPDGAPLVMFALRSQLTTFENLNELFSTGPPSLKARRVSSAAEGTGGSETGLDNYSEIDGALSSMGTATEFTAADVVTNQISTFPFQNVFDFISEINRPPDPATMASLSFNFKVQDFKYDLQKMAKKKNPQEVIDSINCKLTRLQKWEKVLKEHVDIQDQPNPFTDLTDWSVMVKKKFDSLKYLAEKDPRMALETQYDKRKVFLNIIEQWSDRLKRNFKFFYMGTSRRGYDADLSKQEDMSINGLRELTRVFSQSVFLEFEGPDFTCGYPELYFQEDRYEYWSVNCPLADALKETCSWIDDIGDIQNYAFDTSSLGDDTFYRPPSSSSSPYSYSAQLGGAAVSGVRKVDREGRGLPLEAITMHTYSKGYVAERVMYDLWQGLVQWKLHNLHTARNIPTASSSSSSFSSDSGITGNEGNVDRGGQLDDAAAAAENVPKAGRYLSHHEAFLQSVRQVNRFTRSESLQSAKRVRDLYSDWADKSAELVIWWKNLIGELDLNDRITDSDYSGTGTKSAGQRRNEYLALISQISEVIEDVVSEKEFEGKFDLAEQLQTEWAAYKPVLLKAAHLQSVLPSQSPFAEPISALRDEDSLTNTLATGITSSSISTSSSSSSVSVLEKKKKMTQDSPPAFSTPGTSAMRRSQAKAAEDALSPHADLLRQVPQPSEINMQDPVHVRIHAAAAPSAAPSAAAAAAISDLSEEEAFLFIMPRVYRGIDDALEYKEFMDLCELMSAQLPTIAASVDQMDGGISKRYSLMPLHPLMMTQKGEPDFLRRCPHPAVLIYATPY